MKRVPKTYFRERIDNEIDRKRQSKENINDQHHKLKTEANQLTEVGAVG